MSEYPVQVSKVQAPPLREETLARDRLLEWLSVKIHRRAVLLIAEAGYGKTTLLADFSRRTRVRVLWFRLDRGDRDWVGFLAYLVAALRVHVPDFGASTSALLRETATASPPLDTVFETFLRELASLPNEPSALVFDDFHLVDDAPEVRHILRELLTRAPERMSFVFASRREPPVRLARLRALGEVAELGTNDLRFDAAETAQLFRETYEMPLEPAVLAELSRRTEGWPASLQLVRAAIHDRDPAQIRSFIASLSGAEGHLYEYLAEEVVGELPDDLQQFLMRTSVLETVDLKFAAVAAEVAQDAARGFIEDGERHGLFGKGGSRHAVRAHPLVREFLHLRLARSVGERGVRSVHLRVAVEAEPLDWRMAVRHFTAAGVEDEARRVLSAAIETILATGAYAVAADLAGGLRTAHLDAAVDLVLRSRLAQQRADVDESLALAEAALAAEPRSTAVLLNLAAARSLAGDLPGAIEAASLLGADASPAHAALGRLYQDLAAASTDGSLGVAAERIRSATIQHRRDGELHFLGVGLCNEAQIRLAMGDARAGLACAEEAIGLLEDSSAGVELVSARLARAACVAHLGDILDARGEIELAVQTSPSGQQAEVATEAADIELQFGRTSTALAHLDAVQSFISSTNDDRDRAVLFRALALAQAGRLAEARAEFPRVPVGRPHLLPVFELRRQLADSLIRVLEGSHDGRTVAVRAHELAVRQGATVWAQYAALLAQLADQTADPSLAILAAGVRTPGVLSMAAEAVLMRLDHLSEDAVACIQTEASHRPWRWLEAVRRAASHQESPGIRASELLDEIGEFEDVAALRAIARSSADPRAARLGRGLARRLAAKVTIEDLGRVRIRIGRRELDGSQVRRKVLALLCLLLTKARWTATREEVVDALWPDLEPQAALNSLNQTVYFLRRAFEPQYQEQTSPGYVQQDGETIWLDPDLIQARSRTCQAQIRAMSGEPDGEQAIALARDYRGRFALDFAYEEWASAFGDALHASYLRVVERAIRLDIDAGQLARGMFIAERSVEIEPDSEDLQLALLKIYRLAGAHAAAAEQYGRYTKTMRDLGTDPRPLADI